MFDVLNFSITRKSVHGMTSNRSYISLIFTRACNLTLIDGRNKTGQCEMFSTKANWVCF